MTDMRTLERRVKKSNIPVRFLRHPRDLSGLPEDVQTIARGWLDAFLAGRVCGPDAPPNLVGKGLLIDGVPGTGKTTLATTLGMEILSRAVDTVAYPPLPVTHRPFRPVYFDRAGAILETLKASYDTETGPDVEDIVRGFVPLLGPDDYTIALLIVDDFGKEYQTDWAKRLFENLIRSRFDKGLPTIVTTNVPLEKWGEVYGASVGSFAHEAFVHLPMLDSTGRPPADRRRS